MAFLDDLALIEVLLALAAALFAYGGVRVWYAIRSNDPASVRGVLRGLGVPLGAVGVLTLTIAVWGETAWPFPAADGMAGYNIFFFDPLALLGLLLVAYALVATLSLKLEYVGLLAFVSGAVTMFYGWTGYTASPAFTKDPLETFLLYLAFGAAGLTAFPATVVVDHYLGRAESGRTPFAFGQARRAGAGLRRVNARAAQPVAPGVAVPAPAASVSADPAPEGSFRFPAWAQTLVLLFPLFAAIAAIAAFAYFGVTLPGHLGAGAAGAP